MQVNTLNDLLLKSYTYNDTIRALVIIIYKYIYLIGVSEMKSIKFGSKIVAFILALILAASTAITSFAAIGTNTTGSITVKGLEAGATATAYQIMTVNYDSVNDAPLEPEYTWTDSVFAYLKTKADYSDYYDATDKSVTETFSKLTAAQSKTFFADIAAAVTNGTIEITISKSATSGTDLKKQDVILRELPMGEYLVLITGGINVYQPIAQNIIPEYDGNLGEFKINNPVITNLKSSEPSIEKTIPDDADKSVGIGGSVTYQLNVALPDYPSTATASTVYVSDDLPTALDFNNDITVKGVKADGTTEDLAKETYYSQTSSDHSFTLTFNGIQLADYSSLKITYSATANSGIAINDGNVNTATLKYNNNPYITDEWKEKTSTQTVYTYGLDLTKVDKNNADTKLGDAEFLLLTKENDKSTAISFIDLGNGTYRVAEADEEGSITTLVSSSQTDTLGQIKITGLDCGTYYLKETKAPAGGYNLPANAFELTITDANFDGMVDGFRNGYLKTNIQNTTGFTLPTTGGIGTVIFTVSGIALVSLGFAMMVSLRKKAKREAE